MLSLHSITLGREIGGEGKAHIAPHIHVLFFIFVERIRMWIARNLIRIMTWRLYRLRGSFLFVFLSFCFNTVARLLLFFLYYSCYKSDMLVFCLNQCGKKWAPRSLRAILTWCWDIHKKNSYVFFLVFGVIVLKTDFLWRFLDSWAWEFGCVKRWRSWLWRQKKTFSQSAIHIFRFDQEIWFCWFLSFLSINF